ncbi:MAG TPA: sulfatase-like hydrolase/transferase, partial [Bacteroidales bacterium]|nr:sulfatase-like hydrolase/transferase [Bacteroidales bacterium]
GYRTALIGKWHLGHDSGHIPNHHGFDEFFGLLFSNDMNVRDNPSYGHKIKDKNLLSLWRDTNRIDQEVYLPTLTQRYTAEAKNFILKNQDHPFFLYMAHWAPHEPFAASAQFNGKSLYGLYGDVVEEMDYSVGEIFETLNNLNLLDHTIIVISSDNGARVTPQRFGNHDRAGSNGGLRGRKTFTFEGGIRVPSIAYWKDHILRGKEESQPAIMSDWLPTFANITNASLPEDLILDGVDLSPVLFDNEKLELRTLFFYRRDELQAVRHGKWKYKVTDFPTEKEKSKKSFSSDCYNETPVLFNLEEDPWEQNNLLDQYPDIANMLQLKIDSFSNSIGN